MHEFIESQFLLIIRNATHSNCLERRFCSVDKQVGSESECTRQFCVIYLLWQMQRFLFCAFVSVCLCVCIFSSFQSAIALTSLTWHIADKAIDSSDRCSQPDQRNSSDQQQLIQIPENICVNWRPRLLSNPPIDSQ